MLAALFPENLVSFIFKQIDLNYLSYFHFIIYKDNFIKRQKMLKWQFLNLNRKALRFDEKNDLGFETVQRN